MSSKREQVEISQEIKAYLQAENEEGVTEYIKGLMQSKKTSQVKISKEILDILNYLHTENKFIQHLINITRACHLV